MTENMPADALSQDECDAIGADGRDGRGWVTESNLSPAEADALDAYRVRYFGCDLCGAILTIARRSEVEAHRASHMA